MKLTKRMKSSIVQGLIVNAFFLLILVAILEVFIYPRYMLIEESKESLGETYGKLQNVLKKGMDFQDFKSSIRGGELSKDSYTLILMKNISQDFYMANFTNTGSQDYQTYLNDLGKNVSVKKGSDEYLEKDQTLGVVLPIYDQKNIFSDEGLSDFFFINYIENILYSFNLSSKGDLGIGNLKKIGSENNDENIFQEDSLQEDIYSIPLVLDIVGQKKDVIDFIHYFENVGRVSIVGEEVEIYNDGFISKKLEGATSYRNYNIYKNQIADIKTISIQDYPDSSSLKTSGLIETMKGKQAREKISIELEISFYVIGVPGYKMEKYIDDVLILHQETLSGISSDAQKYSSQTYKFKQGEELLAIKNLQSLMNIVSSMGEDIKALRISLAKRENIKKTYEEAVGYQEQLSRIEDSYNKQLEILTQ